MATLANTLLVGLGEGEHSLILKRWRESSHRYILLKSLRVVGWLQAQLDPETEMISS